MSISYVAMSLTELSAYLIGSGTYPTAEVAMATLNMAISEGIGVTGTGIIISGGPASTFVGTVGETALDVAAQAQLTATGTNVSTAGIGLLQGSSSTGVAAILGMDVGAVGAACAPLWGVALGTAMYETNPELWTKISQKLLPFCWPGTTTIPTWAEIIDTATGKWQVNVKKEVAEAIKELLDEEGIGPGDTGSATNPSTGFSVDYATGALSGTSGNYTETVSIPGAKIVSIQSSPPGSARYAISTSPMVETLVGQGPNGAYARSYNLRNIGVTTNGTTYYWDGVVSSNVPLNYMSPLTTMVENNLTKIADAIIDGSLSPSGTYPAGTSQWNGNVPSTLPSGSPAVIGIDSTTGNAITTPTVPISPPIIIIDVPEEVPEVQPETIPFPWEEPTTPGHTVPWPETMPWPLPKEEPDWWPTEIPYPSQYPISQPSNDPEINPDPDKITDPSKQVQPYITPLPIPYEVPTPTPSTETDPTLDPTLPTKPTKFFPPDSPGAPDNPDNPTSQTIDPIFPIGESPISSLPNNDLPFSISQNTGLATVYHPTSAQLYAFERWLWVTYSDATIDKIFNNPFDGVITLFEIYCTPTDVGTQTIKSGFLDSQISSAVISRYTEIDCGTLGIPEYYGNYFDYSPYSKAHIYLPFIGIQELNVDDIVGHAVNVKYRIDEYNGSCIAMITVAKVTTVNGVDEEYSNVMYQFSGNCAVEVPITGGSQASIKAGMMTADAYQHAAGVSTTASLIGGLASLLTGSMGGGISSFVSAESTNAFGQATALSNMLSGKAIVQKSGTFGSSHGALGIKTPFITITRPKQISVPNYNELYGYPAHKMVYIGNCTGFLRCREVNVISATATDDEKSMIEQLLKTGVYVTE